MIFFLWNEVIAVLLQLWSYTLSVHLSLTPLPTPQVLPQQKKNSPSSCPFSLNFLWDPVLAPQSPNVRSELPQGRPRPPPLCPSPGHLHGAEPPLVQCIDSCSWRPASQPQVTSASALLLISAVFVFESKLDFPPKPNWMWGFNLFDCCSIRVRIRNSS